MTGGRQLVVVGGGGHAVVVIDTLIRMGRSPDGVTDADPSRHGKEILGIPVLGGDEVLDGCPPSATDLALGVGSTRATATRKALFETLRERGYAFPPLCHPETVVAASVTLGDGAQVMAGAVIQPGTSLGRGAIVNTGARIDHDCSLGDFVHIAPGAVLAGLVRVGACSHIGCGATVLQERHIGSCATVGAGAVVTHDVADGRCVTGVPARESDHA